MAVFKRGNRYWYAFVFNGRRIQESTKQANLQAARVIEAARKTQLAKAEVGIKDQPKLGHLTVGELLDRKWASYQQGGMDSKANRSQIKKAKAYFGTKTADALTEEVLNAYIDRRNAAGEANATVNRLTDLVRSAYREAKLPAPACKHLAERDNARTGFFSPTEFAAIYAHLEDWLKDYTLFASLTGWRSGSISDLRWEAVDLEEGEVNLPGEFTKNGEPLKLPLEGELAELISRRRELRGVKTANGRKISALVFHREGEPITQAMYQRPWVRACLRAEQGEMICRKCGVSCKHWYHCGRTTKYHGKLLHDFRRTAARDLIRSGTPQSVAMKITGHKTDSMFRRYNITDTDDMRKALRGLRNYRSEREQKVVAIAK